MTRLPPAGPPPGPGETLDLLVADWWIYQLAGGHRFSTDDLLCAWRAAHARPDARVCLDLGCGIGSVGLYLLGILGRDDTTLVGVEAQEVSVGLARRSVARNHLEHRVTIRQGDLRDPASVPEGATYELITGSPPYIPLGKGLLSPHPQRAACRVELRGSIFDYCERAREHLAPGGRFVFVMSARDDRTEAAPTAHGLAVTERMDVVFREGDTPMIAVLTCALSGDATPRCDWTLTVRQRSGAHTPEYAALRRDLGFRDEPRRPRSPEG